MIHSDGPYTLTLDDDLAVHKIIEKSLGMASLPFMEAKAFLQALGQLKPLGIFVDINLDGEASGLDVIPIIRQQSPYCPVIVITGDDSDKSIGQALASGANDFIRKPIHPQELRARYQARAIEMREKAGRDVISMGDIRLDMHLRRLEGQNNSRYLSQSDTDLLAYLMQSQNMIVAKEDLKRRLWGNLKISDNALDKKIYELRQALKDISQQVIIRSSYGRGISLTLAAARKERAITVA